MAGGEKAALLWIAVAALYLSEAQAQLATSSLSPDLRARLNSLDKASAVRLYTEMCYKKYGRPCLWSSNDTHLRDGAVVFESTIRDDVGCKPIPQLVNVPGVENAVTFPNCILLDRCASCCTTPLHECGPKANTSTMTRIQVLRFYTSNNVDLLDPQYEGVNMEVHKECECQCRIKASNCNPKIHTYDADNCQCACKDMSLARQCTGNRRWSYDTCSCECTLRPQACPTGTLLDFTNCQCVSTQVCGNPNAALPPTTMPALPTTTTNPCPNLACPQSYKATLVSATRGCACVYTRA